MSLILNKTTATFLHNKGVTAILMAVSEAVTRLLLKRVRQQGQHEDLSININISMRFNINIFKQHDQQDQQQARVQAQQAGIAITNLITFKCLNIVLCIGGQHSTINHRSGSCKGHKICIYSSWTHVTSL